MSRASLCAVLVASLLSTLSLPALAEPSTEAAVPSPYAAPAANEPEKVWYGWQTLVNDGAATALLLGSEHRPALGWTALAAYAVGGPIVHLANGQAGAAGRSLGLRLGMPMAGALVLGGSTYLLTDRSCSPKDDCGWGQGLLTVGMGMIGAFLGAAGAISIDASLATKPAAPSETGVRFTPTFALAPDRAVLGAVGSF